MTEIFLLIFYEMDKPAVCAGSATGIATPKLPERVFSMSLRNPGWLRSQLSTLR